MNALPGVEYCGPQVARDVVLMLFTDQVTGQTFTLYPKAATLENIQSQAVSIRTDYLRKHNQFAQSCDAFTGGIAAIIASAIPKTDAEVIIDLRTELAVMANRIETEIRRNKADRERLTLELRVKQRIIDEYKSAVEGYELKEKEEESYEDNAKWRNQE